MNTPFLRRADAVIERGMQRIGNSRRVSWFMVGLLAMNGCNLVYDLFGPVAGALATMATTGVMAMLAVSKDEKESSSEEDES